MSEPWLRVCAAALFLGLLWSCGGGGDEEKSSKTDAKATALERARAAAEKAKSDAETEGADKYAPKPWDEAEKFFAEGVEQQEAEDAKTAQSRFAKAKSKYVEALAESRKGKKSVEEYDALKKELVAIQRKAKDAGAEKGAPKTYAAAVEKLKTAEEALKVAPATALRTLKTAKQDFLDAIEESLGAVEDAKKQEKEKQAAAEEKKLALEEKAKADALDAGKTNPVEYGSATDMLRNGDRAFEEERFDEAMSEYRSAKEELRMLVQQINDAKAAGAGETAATEGPRAGPDTDTALEEPKEATAVTETPSKEAPAASGAAGVWAFLDQHKGKLFSCLAEFSGGQVLLNYSNGTDLEKDALPRKAGKSKLIFQREDAGAPVEMSFEAGGDMSAVFIDPQFVRQVRVSMTVEMGVVLAGDAYVVVHVMSDKSGNGYGCKFGAILGRVTSVFGFAPGAPTTVPGAMTKPPKDWVMKEKRDWVLDLAWPEGQETGTLTATFGGKEVSKIDKIKPRSSGVFPAGRVGVSWNKCMFAVKNLKIEGVLDQKWALQKLQGLGVQIPEEILVEAGLKKAASGTTKKTASKEPAAPPPAETDEAPAATTEKKSGEVEY